MDAHLHQFISRQVGQPGLAEHGDHVLIHAMDAHLHQIIDRQVNEAQITCLAHKRHLDPVDTHLHHVINRQIEAQVAHLADELRLDAVDAEGNDVIDVDVAQRGAHLVQIGRFDAVIAKPDHLVDDVGTAAAAGARRRRGTRRTRDAWRARRPGRFGHSASGETGPVTDRRLGRFQCFGGGFGFPDLALRQRAQQHLRLVHGQLSHGQYLQYLHTFRVHVD